MDELISFDLQLTFDLWDMERYPLFQTMQKNGKFLQTTSNLISLVIGITLNYWLWPTSIEKATISFWLICGLLVDTINANMLKAVFRRLRPPGSGMTDMVVIDGPAKFSFPSSCASRVVFTLGFCAFGMTHPIWINLLLASWVICVCLSQVLTRQSFVLDIIGGSVLGALEVYAILNFLSRQHLVA